MRSPIPSLMLFGTFLACAGAVYAQEDTYEPLPSRVPLKVTPAPKPSSVPLMVAPTPSPTAVPSPTPSVAGSQQLTPEQLQVRVAIDKQRAATSITTSQSTFFYARGCRWIEKVNGVQVRSYREQGRNWNGTSITLKNEETDGYLEFRFYDMQVVYNRTSLKVPIESVSNEVNGDNITGVQYSGGQIQMRSCARAVEPIWTEWSNGADSTSFTFAEVGRSILGVTLLDRSRQMQLQLSLDPKRANIYFSTATQPKAEILYGNVRPTAVQFFSMAIID